MNKKNVDVSKIDKCCQLVGSSFQLKTPPVKRDFDKKPVIYLIFFVGKL